MDPSRLAEHALDELGIPLTLKDALSAVVDFRIDRKKKFPLYEILMIAVCALIDGAKGPTDYERFGKAKIGLLKRFLELENGIPSHDTRDALRAKCFNSQQPTTSGQWNKDGTSSFTGCWLLAVGC